MQYTLGLAQLDSMEDVLQSDIMGLGVTCVVLIDMSGNIIAHSENGNMKHDIYSLAALAAGNFAAVSAMAKIIGEGDFSLLFHRGKNESIHFGKVMNNFLLVTIFGKSVALGVLRMKLAEAIGKINKILKETTTEQAQLDSVEDALQFWGPKDQTPDQIQPDSAEDALQFWSA